MKINSEDDFNESDRPYLNWLRDVEKCARQRSPNFNIDACDAPLERMYFDDLAPFEAAHDIQMRVEWGPVEASTYKTETGESR